MIIKNNIKNGEINFKEGNLINLAMLRSINASDEKPEEKPSWYIECVD